jgi:hypothetical protein
LVVAKKKKKKKKDDDEDETPKKLKTEAGKLLGIIVVLKEI